MAFSFFKKDPKERGDANGKAGTRQGARPVGRRAPDANPRVDQCAVVQPAPVGRPAGAVGNADPGLHHRGIASGIDAEQLARGRRDRQVLAARDAGCTVRRIAVRADASRNLLLVQGTAPERASILDTAQIRLALHDSDPAKWVAPYDLARVMLFLASPASDFVTGQTIWVDGGVFSQAFWPYRD